MGILLDYSVFLSVFKIVTNWEKKSNYTHECFLWFEWLFVCVWLSFTSGSLRFMPESGPWRQMLLSMWVPWGLQVLEKCRWTWHGVHATERPWGTAGLHGWLLQALAPVVSGSHKLKGWWKNASQFANFPVSMIWLDTDGFPLIWYIIPHAFKEKFLEITEMSALVDETDHSRGCMGELGMKTRLPLQGPRRPLAPSPLWVPHSHSPIVALAKISSSKTLNISLASPWVLSWPSQSHRQLDSHPILAVWSWKVIELCRACFLTHKIWIGIFAFPTRLL